MHQTTSRSAADRRSFVQQVGAFALGLILAGGLVLTAVAQVSEATGVIVGQALPSLNLKDQHDKPWQVAPPTRLVMFAAGRKASNLAQAVLQTLPKDQLTRRQAVYQGGTTEGHGLCNFMKYK